MAWEDVKEVFRPTLVHQGVMKVDEELCTGCGLCLDNCVFRCFEADDKGIPHMKDEYACMSCFNCTVCCPTDAISIVETFHAHEGPFATAPHVLSVRPPKEPRDAEGNLAEWTTVERTVFNRRSVRNYRNRAVPESLISRVLEAGRFSPSGGNAQPWQFIVITRKALIDEMNKVIKEGMARTYTMYKDEEQVKTLAATWEANPARSPSSYDLRIVEGGLKNLGAGPDLPLLGAPAVILLCGDTRAIGGTQTPIGISGTNMTLVAKSLGLGCCWVGFAAGVNRSPELLEKLGVRKPFVVSSCIVLGYPRFKQEGIVPREFRPIVWHREGKDGMEVEE